MRVALFDFGRQLGNVFHTITYFLTFGWLLDNASAIQLDPKMIVETVGFYLYMFARNTIFKIDVIVE